MTVGVVDVVRTKSSYRTWHIGITATEIMLLTVVTDGLPDTTLWLMMLQMMVNGTRGAWTDAMPVVSKIVEVRNMRVTTCRQWCRHSPTMLTTATADTRPRWHPRTTRLHSRRSCVSRTDTRTQTQTLILSWRLSSWCRCSWLRFTESRTCDVTRNQVTEVLQLPVSGYGTVYRHISEMLTYRTVSSGSH